MSISPQVLLFILRVQNQGGEALNSAALGWTALGAAITATAGMATKAALDFDRSMTKMQTLSSVTADQVYAVSEAIKTLAVVDARPPQEMAEAFRFITSSGFEAAEGMRVVDASAKGAAIGLGKTQEVADAVTTAMNLYGHANLTAADAVGIMAIAVKNGKGETDEMARSIGRVLPFAAQLGVGFDDVAAAVAAMTSNGLTAAEAVTAVRQTLSAVNAPTIQARKVIESMGYTYKDVQKAFREKGYLGGLQELMTMLGNSQVNFRMFVSGIEGTVANVGLLGAGLDNTKRIFEELQAAGGQSLTELFNLAKQSNSFKWDQGVALLQVAMLELGDVIMPMVISSISAVLNVMEAFHENADEIKAVVAGVAATVAVFAAPALWATLVSGLGAATASVTAFTVALLANPLTIIPALVALAVGAFVYFGTSLHEVNGEIVSGWELMKATWAGFVAYIGPAIEFVKNAFQGLWDFISEGAAAVAEFFAPIIASVKGVAAAVASVSGKSLPQIVAGWSATGESAGSAFDLAFAASIASSGAARKAAEAEAKKAKELRDKKPPADPPAPPPDTPLSADYDPRTHVKKPGAGKSEEERQGERIARLIQELHLQAEAYSQTAEQSEYLESVRRAGINTDFLEQRTVEEGIAITDRQVAADKKLGAVREIARTVAEKTIASIREQNVVTAAEVDGYEKLATAAQLSAEARAVETAAIMAQTDAVRQHLGPMETLAAVDQARQKAKAAFKSGSAIDFTDQNNSIEDNIKKMKAQAVAIGLPGREAVKYIAQQDAMIESMRRWGRADATFIKNVGDQAQAAYDLAHHQKTAGEGVIAFMNELQDRAISTGDIVYSSLDMAMRDVSDVIGDALTGQSVAWDKAAADIAGSIAKMIANMLLMKAVMSGLKFLGFADGGTPGLTPSMQTAVPFANGDAFTNQIVSHATAFQFNSNGKKKLGVMGEAGPEAIIPLLRAGNAMAIAAYARDGTKQALALKRGKDGKLGVEMPDHVAFAAGGSFGGGLSVGVGAGRGVPQQIVLAPVVKNDFSGLAKSNGLTAEQAQGASKALEGEMGKFMERWVQQEQRPGGRLAPRR